MTMISIIKGADLRTLQKYLCTKKWIVVMYSKKQVKPVFCDGSSRNCHCDLAGWRETSSKTTLFYML